MNKRLRSKIYGYKKVLHFLKASEYLGKIPGFLIGFAKIAEIFSKSAVNIGLHIIPVNISIISRIFPHFLTV